MRIAIAQINCTVGDIYGNAAKILGAVRQAQQAGAELVITPELALSGYPPADLLLRETFCQSCHDALTKLVKAIDDITVIIGHPNFWKGELYNAASVIRSGKIIHTYHKRIFNNPPFFNESYYFDTGSEPYFLNWPELNLAFVSVLISGWILYPMQSTMPIPTFC